ncbi:hypothetical protein NDU88_005282 [Pleurodeles waltl]|uniref:Uncharacterized protein n=1 Tax=Pleurodeles waltl TaxID=8319 RepID=A0AAV7TUA9_PLEWA|nr:hypothetical protein NDU88_005282 [Pleurodeles waltl]
MKGIIRGQCRERGWEPGERVISSPRRSGRHCDKKTLRGTHRATVVAGGGKFKTRSGILGTQGPCERQRCPEGTRPTLRRLAIISSSLELGRSRPLPLCPQYLRRRLEMLTVNASPLCGPSQENAGPDIPTSGPGVLFTQRCMLGSSAARVVERDAAAEHLWELAITLCTRPVY